MGNQKGFVEATGVLLISALVIGVLFLLFFTKVEFSRQNVSGVAYNVQNDKFISGNTTFSIRAAEDTVVTEENQSSYCLPPNSPYIELVNEAAADKTIKLNITTEKHFTVVSAPWKCVDNVTVKKVNQ